MRTVMRWANVAHGARSGPSCARLVFGRGPNPAVRYGPELFVTIEFVAAVPKTLRRLSTGSQDWMWLAAAYESAGGTQRQSAAALADRPEFVSDGNLHGCSAEVCHHVGNALLRGARGGVKNIATWLLRVVSQIPGRGVRKRLGSSFSGRALVVATSISGQVPYFLYAIHPALVVDEDESFSQLEAQRFPWRERLVLWRLLAGRPFIRILYLTRHD
jgi:hypothetical protein